MRLFNSIQILAAMGSIAMLVSCRVGSASEEMAESQICIDENIQFNLDTLLVSRMAELNVPAAWGAVMEVSTGNLVALSSWENYQDSACSRNNPMFIDLRDPGSAFQVVSYAALLEYGKITPDNQIDTGNTMDHPSSFNFHGKEVRDDHPVGVVTADEAIVQSSNIAIVKMIAEAYEKDPKVYMDAIASLGWYDTPLWVYEGDTLKEPRVREVHDRIWSKVSLGQISYGYEMAVTPMHLLLFFNSIANDGIRPGFGRICSEETAKQVKMALEHVVERGTACTKWADDGAILRQGAKSQKISIAGKTGTAQIYANGTYSGNGYYVTFVGYFPADNPQYSCLVSLKAVPGGNFGRPGGGYMAGPVVRGLAEALLCK